VEITASVAANVWKITVVEGDRVSVGDTLVILESMKMELPVESPVSGMVKSISCKEGDAVDEGQQLLLVE
jgi:acetyl-CoA carboxylase biotin carboxyl carrier protein